ncbi:MAG: aminotransferase class V-fold PLP-dependent enzyme [bacterium]
MMFKNNKQLNSSSINQINFDYMDNDIYYFDSACQTLRPQQVIDAQDEYYHEYNACGHRVKYKWGQIVDEKVEETRALLLEASGKNSKNYTVAFTLNTTIGINFVLQQLNPSKFDKTVTSEIEHNSVFLTTMTWAQRHNKKRIVLPRLVDGELDYKKDDLKNAVVVVNTTSNIDGRNLLNAKQLADDVHEMGGILLLDACQSYAHLPELLKNVDFDAAFGSGHKMYGPSVGFIVIKKDLLKNLDCYLIGGSTVQDVQLDSFELIDNDEEIYSRIEPGLQNFAGIIALGESIKWFKQFKKNGLSAHEYEVTLQKKLNEGLKSVDNLVMLYDKPSSVVSIYSEKIDGHRLGTFLGEKKIMCRTGYHCCHYYLKNLKKYPPLFRISLALHNDEKQIEFLIENLKLMLK